jgi:hypothetical protein
VTAFLTLCTASRGAANGNAGVGLLFGSVFGLSAGQALTAALVGAGTGIPAVATAGYAATFVPRPATWRRTEAAAG